jgi:hypothetical protein
MSFTKGHKLGLGRPKGSQNAIILTARELFIATIESQVPNIQIAFDEVFETDKAKYLELMGRYAQYFVPKKIDVDISQNVINVIIPEE